MLEIVVDGNRLDYIEVRGWHMADKRCKQTLDEDEAQQLQKRTVFEDLAHRRDEEGVGQSLERAVESLRICSDDETNFSALDDAGRKINRATLGMSFASDELFKSAQGHESANTGLSSWKDKINELLQAGPQHSSSGANTRDSDEHDHFRCSRNSSATPVTTEATEEDDWESVVDKLPAPRKATSPAFSKELQPIGNAVKQRGRGAFTNGAMGLYSDYFELNAESNGTPSSSSHSDDTINSDASRVLVFDCSSTVTTKDVEDVLEPYSKEGSCAVRWVDNTRALASFSSPSMAREASVGINDGRFKVSMHSETDVIPGGQPSMNETVQSVPRPASSVQVAQRMIASALSRQGPSKQLRAKNQGSLQEIQEQERQRKLRLQMRAQLRDEAWGSDTD